MNNQLNEYILKKLKEKYENIDEELIKEYLLNCENSSEKYPINIDILVNMKIYNLKKNAKKKLIDNFKENEDYIILKNPNKTGGRPSEDIKLTISCFKLMSLISETTCGKKIRNYYCSLDKIYMDFMIESYKKLKNKYI